MCKSGKLEIRLFGASESLKRNLHTLFRQSNAKLPKSSCNRKETKTIFQLKVDFIFNVFLRIYLFFGAALFAHKGELCKNAKDANKEANKEVKKQVALLSRIETKVAKGASVFCDYFAKKRNLHAKSVLLCDICFLRLI